MKIYKWLVCITTIALVGASNAALLVYEGFEYEPGVIHGLNGGTGFSSAWVSSQSGLADENFVIVEGGDSWGAMTVSSNRLLRSITGGIEAIHRPISADLDAASELWFSVLWRPSANDAFAIAGSALVQSRNPTTTVDGNAGFGFYNANNTAVTAAIWDDTGTRSTAGALPISGLTLIVGKISFNTGTGGADVLSLYSVGTDLVLPATPGATHEVAVDESVLDTLTMDTNRGPGYDEVRIGTSYADVVPVASEFFLTLNPEDSQNIDVGYPAVVATNGIATEYANSTLGVEITALNVTGDSNAFSAVTATPFTLTEPSPATGLLEFEFDASAVKEITKATAGFNANGSVDIIWKNLDDNVPQTNTVALVGRYTNPVFEFSIDSGLSLVLQAPETVVSNDITVSYIEGRPGHTNVEIVAVNILDESHVGSFSAINPGVIPDPEPSSSAITVIFDNAVAGLGNKEGATANLEVVYGEVGESVTYTSTVPVSAYSYDLPAGVVQQVFGSPADVVLGVGAGATALNNFGLYTNQWNADAGLVQNVSGGFITLFSGGNTRSAFNLIEAGTAGVDNFGAADTHILTNGLYRYDFDYEVVETDADNVIWSFNAYALINQGAFSTSSNPDKVTIDLATGTSGGVEVDIENDGAAYYSQHPNGTLRGTGDVARATGSVFLNVRDGEDAAFVMHRSGKCTVRMYDLVLTRIGDYDPNTDTNSANAVIAAKFNDIASTNAIITGLTSTDCNTNGVGNTWRGNNVLWDSQSFKTLVNDGAVRTAAIVTRAGSAGYDDVGVADTIPLSQGSYDLTMDVNITGSFPSNDSVAKVEFYAISQDLTGDVNDVIIKHSLITDEYMVANGSAGIALLASKEYTTNVVETLSLTNMTVLDGQDVAIVFYNQNGPDTVVDNVELVRTGDAVLEGYAGWALGFPGFYDTALTSDPDGDGVNNLLEYAFNGDPTVGDASILPDSFPGEDGGTNWLYHVHTERTDDGTLTYTVEAGTDLVYTNWSAAGIDYVDESAVVDSYKSVTNRTDMNLSAEFIRLQVEKD